MKLESTLPPRSGFLHFTPVLDVAVLLLIFFLLGSNFVLHSGVTVDLPSSTSQAFHPSRNPISSPSPPAKSPSIFFNEEPITLSTLQEKIGGEDRIRNIIIHADELATFGLVIRISNAVLDAGYNVAFATEPTPGS